MSKKTVAYTFVELSDNLSNDALTEFINGMHFIPHACGYQVKDPFAVCSERITGDFELLYIIGGTSIITVENGTYTCNEGDAVLIPPFTMHKIQTLECDPHENFWIHFDIYPFHLQKDFIAAMLVNGGYKIHPGISQDLIQLYRSLMNEMNTAKPGRMLFFNTILVQIIASMLRLNNSPALSEKTVTNVQSAEAETIRRSLEIIQKGIYSGLGVKDLCNELHVSESWLFKAFSNILNIPPNRFIQMIRIKRAEQLMKCTSLSINEISEILCFSSPYYFSNVFKKYYKISPRHYMSLLASSSR